MLWVFLSLLFFKETSFQHREFFPFSVSIFETKAFALSKETHIGISLILLKRVS